MNTVSRIAYLDSIRTIAIFMVVVIHSIGYVPIEDAKRLHLTFIVHTIAVPIFFLVDGIIFAKTSHKQGVFRYRQYMMKSAKRLLIPWAVFSATYLFIRAILEFLGFFSQHVVVGSSWVGILKSLYLSEISNQMYFLLSLFFIRSLALVSHRVARFSGWIVSSLCACYICITVILHKQISELFAPSLDPILHAILGLKFYLLGFVLYKWDDICQRNAIPATFLALFVLILLKCFSLSASIVQVSYLLFVYLFSLAFLHRETFLSRWGRFTIGVYLLHMPIILKGLSLFVLGNGISGLPGLAVVAIAGFFVSLFCAMLLDKTSVGRFAVGSSATIW